MLRDAALAMFTALTIFAVVGTLARCTHLHPINAVAVDDHPVSP